MEPVFELGRFGDRRLEKGGPSFTVPWLRGRPAAFAGWLANAAARFNSIVFCAISG
jgi:hypothetical protein